jgi:hypothetical protein
MWSRNTAYAEANALECPDKITDQGHQRVLERASVFEGPPEELADLIPVAERWDLEPYQGTDRSLYLVCRYKQTNTTVTNIIPSYMRECTTSRAAKPAISCH